MAAAPIQPLAWEPPYAVGATQENGKKTKKKKKTDSRPLKEFHSFFILCPILAHCLEVGVLDHQSWAPGIKWNELSRPWSLKACDSQLSLSRCGWGDSPGGRGMRPQNRWTGLSLPLYRIENSKTGLSRRSGKNQKVRILAM